jgi:hypothetical protein
MNPSWLTEDMRRSYEFVREASDSVWFQHAGIPTHIRASIGGHPDDTLNGRSPRLYVRIETHHRDSGELISIQLGDDIPITITSREEATEFIYDRVRHAWIHELNEAMFVDGARRRDLHVPGTPSTVELKITEEIVETAYP